MNLKSNSRTDRGNKAQRRAVRKAGALSPDHQALTAVYALGIRDGLRIAADILTKTRKTEGDA